AVLRDRVMVTAVEDQHAAAVAERAVAKNVVVVDADVVVEAALVAGGGVVHEAQHPRRIPPPLEPWLPSRRTLLISSQGAWPFTKIPPPRIAPVTVRPSMRARGALVKSPALPSTRMPAPSSRPKSARCPGMRSIRFPVSSVLSFVTHASLRR